jgi:MerR family redox-sensitive transcriptional activator SoxR
MWRRCSGQTWTRSSSRIVVPRSLVMIAVLARARRGSSVSEVSRRSGIASSALRFYQERGLIASERAGSGAVAIPRAVLRRIAFIIFAQKIGLTLEEIGAELAKLPTDRIPTRGDWARLSGRWTKQIDQRIEELQRLRDGLTQCIGCGCLSITGAG